MSLFPPRRRSTILTPKLLTVLPLSLIPNSPFSGQKVDGVVVEQNFHLASYTIVTVRSSAPCQNDCMADGLK